LPSLLDPALLGILGFALLSNIPLGYLREGSPRFSVRWFVFIHLSIPFIIALRVVNGVSWRVIPITIGLAVAGQIVGSRVRRHSRR
jgi:phosphatidylserine synthase